MTIKELVYSFKLKGDKLDSQYYSNLRLAQIIIILNEAQLSLVKSRYSQENPNQKGFEATQERKDEFQKLLIPEEELKVAQVNPFTFTADITSTKETYLHLARLHAIGSKECCGDIVLNGFDCQTDDLNTTLIDPATKPNFEWRRFPYRMANNKFWLYTDKSFKIEKLIIDYLRYPKKMDMAGYVHFNSAASTDIDCELPEFVHDDIVDLAVKNCKLYLGDVNGAQAMESKILK